MPHRACPHCGFYKDREVARSRRGVDRFARSPMIKIAVDAMGSDHAPEVEVDGAIQAAAQYGRSHRSGRSGRPCCDRCWTNTIVTGLPIEVVHASEVVTMEDSAATAVRRKKDSSIRVAATADARWQGVRSRQCRQYRRRDGNREVGGRALFPLSIGRRSRPSFRRKRESRRFCSTSAPMSIASRFTSNSSPSWATSIRARSSAFAGRASVCCRSVKKTRRETN